MKQIKVELKIIIDKALKSLSFPEKNYSLSTSKNIEFGDLSCNIALLLSKNLKKSPMNIGKIIIDRINNNSIKYISNISLTNPGFINFKIHNQFFLSQITTIIEKGEKYGRGEQGIGQTANVEFVSANPTGPLNVGHGRNAVLGDTISSLLEWQGFKVTREYYFNDAGRQMRILAQSVEARYYELLGKNSNFPEDGYLGSYIKDIAQIILDDEGSELPVESTIFKDKAEKIIFNQIKDSLIKLGVNFDQFTNEKTFYENGDIENFIKKLREKNLIYDKDNATWFKTSELGQNKDKVYVKSTGEPTYRVPDTAYHRDKIKRNYDLIIDIFGADHADAYPDVITGLKALGYNTDHIKVLIYQFVTLLKGGDKIKMSTRKGDFVTLDQLINDVGVDVVRYFFIMRSMNSHLDFDLDLAADQSDKNPVYYLQYAHARISNIISRANGLNIIMDNEFDPSLIRHNDEISLLKYMVRFPEFIELAYDNLEPQNIANYLQELSARFHKFYNSCRVITDDIELSRSRLAVINAVKIILVNGFSILGITAPERM
ncbi:MAG: arginine--tRNA ligase [Candidatus Marinimicrobia bacterium]|nr:arginine--tRNA ligase [Candidatus Neomarinimicrobiota bacterium]